MPGACLLQPRWRKYKMYSSEEANPVSETTQLDIKTLYLNFTVGPDISASDYIKQ